MYTEVRFTIAKIWKQPKCPSTGKIKKMWYIYIQSHEIQLQKRMQFCH